MTNLTEQYLKRIVDIENYLAQLHTLVPNAPIFDLTEPIVETKEVVQYVKCLTSVSPEAWTVGKCYKAKVTDDYPRTLDIIANDGINRNVKDWNFGNNSFTPISKEEYTDQQGAGFNQQKEVKQERWKPSEDEIFWFINNVVNPICSRWDNSNNQQKLHKYGNCFKTEQEAQEKANQIKELLSKK